MDEARVALSRTGRLARTICARDISSREHARKLWPLVTPTPPYRMVAYISPTFDEDGNLLRRSHFRELSGKRIVDLKARFDSEEAERRKSTSESEEHKAAKTLIARALQHRLHSGLAMPWAFSDPDATDFYLSGNLLLGAKSIALEHELSTGFGSKYRLDVAVLSAQVRQRPLLLGGIEIELGHAFDGRKALIGKSQAFPLISIDITGMPLADITPRWADRALTATTASATDRRRKTFVYLHDLLYPLYLQLPEGLLRERTHQFLVFASDEGILKLFAWVKRLGETLGLQDGQQFSVSRVTTKSEQSAKMLRNAGDIVGADWEEINSKQCLRITVERPVSIFDQAGYFFHLTLAKLLLTELDTLVGYKYMNGILNEHPEEDLWIHDKWIPETSSHQRHRVLPSAWLSPVLTSSISSTT
jgi:hypothetical protein